MFDLITGFLIKPTRRSWKQHVELQVEKCSRACNMGRPMLKRVLGHMRTAKAQIRAFTVREKNYRILHNEWIYSKGNQSTITSPDSMSKIRKYSCTNSPSLGCCVLWVTEQTTSLLFFLIDQHVGVLKIKSLFCFLLISGKQVNLSTPLRSEPTWAVTDRCLLWQTTAGKGAGHGHV